MIWFGERKRVGLEALYMLDEGGIICEDPAVWCCASIG